MSIEIHRSIRVCVLEGALNRDAFKDYAVLGRLAEGI